MHSSFSRRQFLRTTAGVAGSAVAASVLPIEPLTFAQEVAAGDRVRFGIIGVGMQGSGLLSAALQLPGAECLSACDLYDGRHILARELATPALPVTRRYQDLLDNKQIDCIIAAVPDHWHKKIVIDCVNAGKDVYCEKPMSHTFADGVAMVAAAKKSGRIVQVGSQRTSSALFAKAKELFAGGAIGELLNVELTLGRNDPSGAWEYPPPPDLSPATLDWDTWLGDTPKKPFDPFTFARWRCWREYGTGVAGDLMVHLISGFQYVTGINAVPDRAVAYGGIVRWKDGRNMPDLHTVLFEYGHVPVYVRLTLGTETPETTRLLGTKGLIEISQGTVRHVPQTGQDSSPSYYASSYPRAMREEYYKSWHAEHDPPPGQSSVREFGSWSAQAPDDVRPHLWNFFQAVRSRNPVVQDAAFGHHAAAACHMANQSYAAGSPVRYDRQSDTIRTS